MKKVLCLLLVAVLGIGMVSGCGKKEEPKKETRKEEKKDIAEKEFQGLKFEVPGDWEEKNSTQTELYFFPQNAMMLVQYSEDAGTNIQDPTDRELFINGFSSGFEDFELKEQMDQVVSGTNGVKFTATFSQDGTNYDSTAVVFNHNNGIMAFMLASDQSVNKKYDKQFEAVIDSVQNVNGAVSSGNENGQSVNSDEVLNQINVNAVKTLDGTVCAFITNASNVTVDELQIQLNYKDENGATIDVQEDWHDMVLPQSTVVSRINAPENYTDFEVVKHIELGVHPRYENHAQELEVASNKGEGGVIVEITNNSQVKIDEIEIIAVMYQGDSIAMVTYPDDILDVEPGRKITEKLDASYGLEFDRFEIYLNQAHTFGF